MWQCGEIGAHVMREWSSQSDIKASQLPADTTESYHIKRFTSLWTISKISRHLHSNLISGIFGISPSSSRRPSSSAMLNRMRVTSLRPIRWRFYLSYPSIKCTLKLLSLSFSLSLTHTHTHTLTHKHMLTAHLVGHSPGWNKTNKRGGGGGGGGGVVKMHQST